MMSTLLVWLNRFLVLDVFVVLFGFLWFIGALAGEAGGFSLGYDLWLQLWIPVFQPAISILILGALGNGLAKKIRQWQDNRKAP
ncbi:MAG: hypothetical protein ACK5CA_08315 [Cyanobacteriota bacterium]|jgi:hypothetical protein